MVSRRMNYLFYTKLKILSKTYTDYSTYENYLIYKFEVKTHKSYVNNDDLNL